MSYRGLDKPEHGVTMAAMKYLFLAALGLMGCSTADASSGPAEYRTVGCAAYSDTGVTYTGIDRRVLERSVMAVNHDTDGHSLVLFPNFQTVAGGIEARVRCYGTVDFVREY